MLRKMVTMQMANKDGTAKAVKNHSAGKIN